LQAAAAAAGKIIVFTTLAYAQADYPNYGTRMARLLEIAHARGARGLKIAKVLGLGLRDPSGQLIGVTPPSSIRCSSSPARWACRSPFIPVTPRPSGCR
jgi:hypothetical protein